MITSDFFMRMTALAETLGMVSGPTAIGHLFDVSGSYALGFEMSAAIRALAAALQSTPSAAVTFKKYA
jgi:hypothetical protein